MMKYLVRLTDASEQHMVSLTLPEAEVQKTAVDVIFDVIGYENPDELVKESVVSEAQLEDLKLFQRMIFARDDQGFFIKDGISFTANGKELNPEIGFATAFVPAELDGMKYQRCDLHVVGANAVQANGTSAAAQAQVSQEEQMQALARIMFLHQIALNSVVDVTKDNAEIDQLIAWAEHEELIEIDVQKAAYRLTEKGKALHGGYITEAQELIKKFDIYADVDMDASGSVHFDTGLGSDLRVPMFELNGVDPFRARFLLGLNDGEWDQLSNWKELVLDLTFYQRMFEPIEHAPGVDDIGKDNLARIQDEGKTVLRREIH